MGVRQEDCESAGNVTMKPKPISNEGLSRKSTENLYAAMQRGKKAASKQWE
jgi:hypothetical protein